MKVVVKGFMEAARAQKREFFDEFGLEVVDGDVEVGQTYPLFGMITKVLEQSPGKIRLELNFNIIANVTIEDEKRAELLRERAFESGIFVSKVTANAPVIEVDCQTIIFGRRQAFQA